MLGNKQPWNNKEIKKPTSNTGSSEKTKTPCGLTMDYEEAIIHDCYHCRQARKDAGPFNYQDPNADITEKGLEDWQNEKTPPSSFESDIFDSRLG